MTVYEVVEARAADCGQMARKLRHAHGEALGVLGADTHRELRARFDQSSFRKAWRVDGRLVGLGGVEGPALASTGFVWLAFTEDAYRHRRTLLVTARATLDALMRTKRELRALILLRDEASFRFAKRLGFVVSDEETNHFEVAVMTFQSAKQSRLA